jgi:hypothetical protein
MRPKEKAKELVGKYLEPNGIVFGLDVAKQCALIAVYEILDSYTKEKSYGYIISDKIIPYWEEVKQEIEKL